MHSLLPYGTGICHFAFIYHFWNCHQYQHVLALCALLTRIILTGLTLWKCVWCLWMYVLCYVCIGIGCVDWLEKRIYIYIYMRRVLKCEFAYNRVCCPEVTLCGWQDINIQLLSVPNLYMPVFVWIWQDVKIQLLSVPNHCMPVFFVLYLWSTPRSVCTTSVDYGCVHVLCRNP